LLPIYQPILDYILNQRFFNFFLFNHLTISRNIVFKENIDLKALAVVKSVGQTMEQKFIGALDLSDYVIIAILNFLTADSPRYGHPSVQGRRRWTQTYGVFLTG